ETFSAVSSIRPETVSGNDGSSWVNTVSPPCAASSASTGAVSSQVGQSRFTTAINPSAGNVTSGLGTATSLFVRTSSAAMLSPGGRGRLLDKAGVAPAGMAQREWHQRE